jgi:predicted acylesterase/phospholipase RssA
MDNVSDFNHLARMLIGRPTGLVLSGGGARGIAHLGVYQALLEAGIDIDLIGGTSMGALAAGTINLYGNPETMVGLAEKYFSSKMLHDYTLPVSSLLASKKVSQVLQSIFGETQIEDLWRPFFCISSNLTRSEMVIHRRGDLWKAVRASSAIPGIFAPVSYQGDILVDGGAMNHFPVDIMHAECEGGTVIAVNASPSKEGGPVWDFGPSISGWKVLWNKISPFGRREKVPSMFTTITRSTNVHSKSRLQEMAELADVLIEPETGQYGVMEWSAHSGLIEIGYQAGKAKLLEHSIH